LPRAVVAASIASGIALRFAWASDIEYKADERQIFDEATSSVSNRWNFGMVGAPTSMGPPAPGMALWLFAGLAYLTHAHTAPALAQAVQTMNVLALLALVAFAFAAFKDERRERWLWACGLWAVNPIAVILERKLWPPSLLPLGMVTVIVCWWYRRNFFASFLCAFVLAFMAQVHLGIFFLAVALFIWTRWRDGREVRSRAWFSGGAIASLPALPWLIELLGHPDRCAGKWGLHTLKLHYFTRWLLQPFGFGVDYTLGRADTFEFLKWPVINGIATYGMIAAHALLALIFLWLLVRAGRVARTQRLTLQMLIVGSEAETTLIAAMLWGYGGLLTLLTLIGADSHRHYMAVVAPIMALWCVRFTHFGLERRDTSVRRVLTSLCILQIAISATLLTYIHHTQIIQGEYGPTWRSQQ
jgi:hypothetical protein